MNENAETSEFDNFFEDKLPRQGFNKRFHVRQLSSKIGNDSDSSLESVDLNISSNDSKIELQKSESPKNLDENINFNSPKVQYTNKILHTKGRSLDHHEDSEDKDFVIKKYSLSPKNKISSKQLKPQFTLENFNKRFSLPAAASSIVDPSTNSASSASSNATSPSSSTSHQTFNLSLHSNHQNSVFDDLLFEIYNRCIVGSFQLFFLTSTFFSFFTAFCIFLYSSEIQEFLHDTHSTHCDIIFEKKQNRHMHS